MEKNSVSLALYHCYLTHKHLPQQHTCVQRLSVVLPVICIIVRHLCGVNTSSETNLLMFVNFVNFNYIECNEIFIFIFLKDVKNTKKFEFVITSG